MNSKALFDLFVSNNTLNTSIGLPALDIRNLQTQHALLTFDPGFKNTCACSSEICYIDGDRGILLYRGYSIEDITAQCQYEDVIALLLQDTPLKHQSHTALQKQIQDYQANLPSIVSETLHSLTHNMHPMAMLMALMSVLAGTLDPNEASSTQALKLIAWMPIMVANTLRHHMQKNWVHPNPSHSYSEGFLAMLLNSTKVDTKTIRIFDTLLMLHADHEQNASTHCVRAVGSSKSSLAASITAGIASLWGPLHGGANEACLNMLEDILHTSSIEEALAKAKDKNDPFRLMGFGHRVYKNYDPRAKIIRSMARNFLSARGDADGNALFKIAIELEDKALSDPYFVDHKLFPNVDYYSGLVQSALGIPKTGFTSIFALGRLAGWSAHWLESNAQRLPIVRPRQLYVGKVERKIP